MKADGTVRKITAGDPHDPDPQDTGNGGFDDNQPAKDVVLLQPRAMDVAPDGSVYIGGGYCPQSGVPGIQRIDPSGIIRRVSNTEPGQFGGKRCVEGIAAGPNGELYYSETRWSGSSFNGEDMRRLDPDGSLVPIGGDGNGSCCADGLDGLDPRSLNSFGANAMDVTREGVLYIAGGAGIYAFGPDNKLVRVAGRPTNGSAAIDRRDNLPGARRPDDRLRVRRGARQQALRRDERGDPNRRDAPARLLAERVSGPLARRARAVRVRRRGRHLRTQDAVSGLTLYTFGYDSAGRLINVEDRYGRKSTIERDSSGKATAFVTPAGTRTGLTVNADGNLATVSQPGGAETHLTYGANALLTGETDASGGQHKFTYDSHGLIESDENADGVKTTVTETETPRSRRVKLTSPLGKELQYLNETPSPGTRKRTRTDPTGAQTVATLDETGTQTTTFPDGRTATTKATPDRASGCSLPMTSRAR